MREQMEEWSARFERKTDLVDDTQRGEEETDQDRHVTVDLGVRGNGSVSACSAVMSP